MLVKVVLHGILKDRFPSIEIDGDTAAEVIEGWGRQVGMEDIPIDDRPIVEAAGYPSELALRQQLEKGVTEIHLVPAMFGGGGNIGKIIIGSVLVVGGILIGGPIGAAMIVSGAMSILGGIVGFFMKAPTLSKEDDPEASKYLGGGGNTTRIGTIIPIGGGRYRIGGHYLSLQVNSSDLVYGSFPSSPPA